MCFEQCLKGFIICLLNVGRKTAPQTWCCHRKSLISIVNSACPGYIEQNLVPDQRVR